MNSSGVIRFDLESVSRSLGERGHVCAEAVLAAPPGLAERLEQRGEERLARDRVRAKANLRVIEGGAAPTAKRIAAAAAVVLALGTAAAMAAGARRERRRIW
ncbi:hypothetical protein WMF45_11635 [Sorangium sp. So ce448]|uniref:hypothetical protein n=1 Tax=Sorangium sp. So ce448 TaxID=3133314 RepID=UPI003F5DBF9B